MPVFRGVSVLFTILYFFSLFFKTGTFIGANANEAVYGVSQADFISKLQISLKETAETEYWLRLLLLSGYIDEKLSQSLIDDCLEIKRILIASLKTAKNNK